MGLILIFLTIFLFFLINFYFFLNLKKQDIRQQNLLKLHNNRYYFENTAQIVQKYFSNNIKKTNNDVKNSKNSDPSNKNF